MNNCVEDMFLLSVFIKISHVAFETLSYVESELAPK